MQRDKVSTQTGRTSVAPARSADEAAERLRHAGIPVGKPTVKRLPPPIPARGLSEALKLVHGT
jgi:hypothetical protein